MRNWMLASLLCLLQLWSCSEFPEQTEHGFEFTYHRQLGKERAQIGDELYVQFAIRTAEIILFESPNGEGGMRTVLQDPSLNPIKDPDPIADVLPLMGEGDSVTVRMPVDDEMREAFGLQSAEFIFYEVAVRQIVKEGETKPEVTAPDAQPEVDTAALVEQDLRLREGLEQNDSAKHALEQLTSFLAKASSDNAFESGLFVEVIDLGSRTVVAEGERVQVRHIGANQDGLLIAESFTGAPFTYTRNSGQVIKAWEEALEVVSYGGKMLMGVPPVIGYGSAGKLPYIAPNDTLYYYFEVLEPN